MFASTSRYISLIFVVAAILNILCKEFMAMNVSTILFLSNYEMYGRETAAAQYLLQLAGYLGLPVVSWNADNSGLERVSGTLDLLSPLES